MGLVGFTESVGLVIPPGAYVGNAIFEDAPPGKRRLLRHVSAEISMQTGDLIFVVVGGHYYTGRTTGIVPGNGWPDWLIGSDTYEILTGSIGVRVFRSSNLGSASCNLWISGELID